MSSSKAPTILLARDVLAPWLAIFELMIECPQARAAAAVGLCGALPLIVIELAVDALRSRQRRRKPAPPRYSRDTLRAMHGEEAVAELSRVFGADWDKPSGLETACGNDDLEQRMAAIADIVGLTATAEPSHLKRATLPDGTVHE